MDGSYNHEITMQIYLEKLKVVQKWEDFYYRHICCLDFLIKSINTMRIRLGDFRGFFLHLQRSGWKSDLLVVLKESGVGQTSARI